MLSMEDRLAVALTVRGWLELLLRVFAVIALVRFIVWGGY